MALLTEGEVALSWIDSERENNNTNASPTLDHNPQTGAMGARLTASASSLMLLRC